MLRPIEHATTFSDSFPASNGAAPVDPVGVGYTLVLEELLLQVCRGSDGPMGIEPAIRATFL